MKRSSVLGVFGLLVGSILTHLLVGGSSSERLAIAGPATPDWSLRTGDALTEHRDGTGITIWRIRDGSVDVAYDYSIQGGVVTRVEYRPVPADAGMK